jgi:putative MATE family efflux protein
MTGAAPRSRDAAATRRRLLLEGPILATLLRLAAPTVLVLVIQTSVGVVETYFVGFLGTDALAGVSLVFPVLMLMQMMSNGAIGGGISAAVARAIGAGRQGDADALAIHALVLGLGLGFLFMLGERLGGRVLFQALGGSDGALAAALAYAGIVFAGAPLIWTVSLLAAALRGSGNTVVPALVTLAGVFILVPLSPTLIFGWGGLPRLGIAGAGVAVVVYYGFAAVALLWYLRSGRAALALTFNLRRIERRLLADVLRVGGLSAIGTIQANLTVILVTGAVGLFGADAIAGYGMAARLDYVLIPLLFGLGTAVVAMVGANIGAGAVARARRIAWTAGLLAAAVAEMIGLVASFAPGAWLGLFSDDPAVLAVGALYLRSVAPFYGAFGLGLILYFGGQGAGRVAWPVAAGAVRLVVAALFGWFLVAGLGLGLPALFAAIAVATLVFGAITAAALLISPWGGARRAMATA